MITCQGKAAGASSVQRGLGRALTSPPKLAPVERLLRRARAPEPAPRETLRLGVEITLRELHQNVNFYNTPL